jgi:biotin operon repressor
MEKLGLFGFQDRRSSSVLRQLESVAPVTLSVEAMGKRIEIPVVAERNLLEIPESNVLQSKVVLLTLLQSRFLSAQQVSEVLGLSQRHTRELSRRLSEQDVFALIDQRKGQLSDYRFTAELKAELIQQFAVEAISGQKTSSRYLAVQLAERCQTDLSERTIRFHMKRMGLSGIAKSLPKLVAALKKTPPDTEESGR